MEDINNSTYADLGWYPDYLQTIYKRRTILIIIIIVIIIIMTLIIKLSKHNIANRNTKDINKGNNQNCNNSNNQLV